MLIVGKKKRRIFTKEEADKRGIRYVHWTSEPNKGDWVITDDDYVLQVLGVYFANSENKNPQWFRRTCLGSWANRTKEFSYKLRKNNTRVFGKDRDTRVTFRQKIIAELLISGMPLVDALKCIYPTAKHLVYKAKILNKHDRFINYLGNRVMERNKEFIEAAGLTDEFVGKKFKKLLNIDIEKNPHQARLLLDALQTVCALKGVIPENEPKRVEALEATYKETHITKTLLTELESEKEVKQIEEAEVIEEKEDDKKD
jgi:hypothetical protein